MTDEILTERIRVSTLGCYAIIRRMRNDVGTVWEDITLSTEPPLQIVYEPKERIWP